MLVLRLLILFFLSDTFNSQRISEIECKKYVTLTMKTSYAMSLPGHSKRKITLNKCQHRSIALITGGKIAKNSEFPHQALLGYEKDEIQGWFCGGSLVSNKFVLTAAHCLKVINYGSVKYAKLGMNNRTQTDERVFTYEVIERFKHPDYVPKNSLNDIALLKLNDTVKFTEFLYPICLPTSQPDNMKAIVTGFGQTGRDHHVTQELMKVILDRFPYDECKKIIGGIDEDSMICFGHRKDIGDACRGDSGGPIQVGNEGVAYCTYKILGVVSFGAKQCGTPGVPGVYSNVYHYIDWIEGIVWGQ